MAPSLDSDYSDSSSFDNSGSSFSSPPSRDNNNSNQNNNNNSTTTNKKKKKSNNQNNSSSNNNNNNNNNNSNQNNSTQKNNNNQNSKNNNNSSSNQNNKNNNNQDSQNNNNNQSNQNNNNNNINNNNNNQNNQNNNNNNRSNQNNNNSNNNQNSQNNINNNQNSQNNNNQNSKNNNNKQNNNNSNNDNNNEDNQNNNNDRKKKSSHSPPSRSSDNDNHSSSQLIPISSNDSASSSSKSSSNNATTKAGVLVGVGLLIIVIVAIVVVYARKKKKKQQMHLHKPVRYHNNNSPKAQNPYNPNWYSESHPSEAHSSGVMAQQGGWPIPPPPPMMSSDMSGAFSSGPIHPPVPPPHPSLALGFNKSTFNYDELAAATQGFSQANVLGEGGFGFVHKGILPNGKEIAVKSLKSGSGQGEREFQAEVEIISRVHHRHLVSLVGYCIAGGQRMLVYEFVPNKTLEFHLHGKGQPIMDFTTRHKIALGSAKGLAYLHEDCHPRIIHRDIKTANILLDDTFEAKVADFGLAKLSTDNYTHVSTRVMGTFGYLAPEYAASGKLTDKSDVFSFGVMLLELITGRRPIDPTGDEDSLVDWARPQFSHVIDEGTFEGLVDPCLENNFNPQEMTRMVACAAASIRHSAKRRPKMSQIVRALEGDMSLDALNEGVKSGQSTYFGTNGEGSSDYDANSYQQDMQKFRMALDSEDYSSSDYGTSNEYGQTRSGLGTSGFGARNYK